MPGRRSRRCSGLAFGVRRNFAVTPGNIGRGFDITDLLRETELTFGGLTQREDDQSLRDTRPPSFVAFASGDDGFVQLDEDDLDVANPLFDGTDASKEPTTITSTLTFLGGGAPVTVIQFSRICRI